MIRRKMKGVDDPGGSAFLRRAKQSLWSVRCERVNDKIRDNESKEKKESRLMRVGMYN